MKVDYRTVKNQLFNVLLDKEVADDTELYGICLQAKKELEQDEAESLIFTRLSQSLSLYLMSHNYQAPKSVMDLAKEIQKVSQDYRSQVAWSQILGNLFSGGSK